MSEDLCPKPLAPRPKLLKQGASALSEPVYTSARKYERKKSGQKKELYRPGLDDGDRISGADII